MWARLWAMLPEPAKQFLYGLDRGLNRALGGDPNETVSEWLARDQMHGGWRGRLGCSLLERADPGHCQRINDKAQRL